MAGVMMPVMTAGLNQLPQRLTAHGTAMANTMRGVATSVGTAFLVSIYTNQTQDHLGSMLAGKGIRLPENMELSGSSAKEALAKLSPEMQHQIKTALNHALIQGMDDAFMVATGLATLAFVLSFFIKKTSPPDEQPETAKEPKASMASEG
ncbi:MAG TPA: hypothetical protein VFK37_03660, partial [Bacillales bacterium]|nr:hypothetical protein [Bacillales bacterium]